MELDELTTSYIFRNASPEELDSLEKALTPDLYKAKRDTSKLVQVERQITSPQGNSFTRKYWVNPNQVRSTDTVIGGAQNLRKKPDNGGSSKGSKGGPKGGSVDSIFSASGRDARKSAIASAISGGYSRDDIMSAAKKNGVSWKEADNPAVNWMRASMAITGTSTRGAKASNQSQQAPRKQRASSSKGTTKVTKSNEQLKAEDSIHEYLPRNGTRSAIESIAQKNNGNSKGTLSYSDSKNLVNAMKDVLIDTNAIGSNAQREVLRAISQVTGITGNNGSIIMDNNGYGAQTIYGIDSDSNRVMLAMSDDRGSIDVPYPSEAHDFFRNKGGKASTQAPSPSSSSKPRKKSGLQSFSDIKSEASSIPALKGADIRNNGGVVEIDAKKGSYGNMSVTFTRNLRGTWSAEATWPGHSIPAAISMGGKRKFSSLKTAHEAAKLKSMSPRIKGATQGLSGKSGLTLAGKKPGK